MACIVAFLFVGEMSPSGAVSVPVCVPGHRELRHDPVAGHELVDDRPARIRKRAQPDHDIFGDRVGTLEASQSRPPTLVAAENDVAAPARRPTS
jgi:hypothetical protein